MSQALSSVMVCIAIMNDRAMAITMVVGGIAMVAMMVASTMPITTAISVVTVIAMTSTISAIVDWSPRPTNINTTYRRPCHDYSSTRCAGKDYAE